MDSPRPSANEHWDIVASLTVSTLYLAANQTYRGHCQLIFDPRHVTRIDELSVDEWAALSRDLHRASRAVVQAVRPDHLNLETLGNVVPHLHFHIVPRYRDDPRWGAPIWTSRIEDMPDTRLVETTRQALIGAIRAAVDA